MRQHRALSVTALLLDLLGFAAFLGAVYATAQPLAQGALAALAFLLISGGAVLMIRVRRLRLEAQPARARASRRR